ncbi:MAG: exodeoxyribonuclease VII small subunit [Bacteroidales bacterium]|nr:exodeoxyribonuclease VII small subunit [Bacteroidales bacterium]
MKNFDYEKTVGEIEKIIAQVEDPSTGMEKAETLIAKASRMLEDCEAYLRSEKENIKD